MTYKGVVERTALLEEALQSEVFIYLPTASETHHTLVLDMMMADQLILAQRFPSVQQVLDKERGVFLEQASPAAPRTRTRPRTPAPPSCLRSGGL